jgi:hypothetical protein
MQGKMGIETRNISKKYHIIKTLKLNCGDRKVSNSKFTVKVLG